MIQFKENARRDGRTEGPDRPILLDPSNYRQGSKKALGIQGVCFINM